MITTPALRKCFKAEVLKDEGVLLLSEFGDFALTGSLNEQVIPLIDGTRSTDEIVGELQDRHSAEQVYFTLLSLEKQGFVAERRQSTNGRADAELIWDYLPPPPGDAVARIRGARVQVRSTPRMDTSALFAALDANGLEAADDGSFTIFVADDYLRPEIAEFNKASLAACKPWMLVKPVGAVSLLGPIFVPGVTGCWECLAQRYRGNREIEEFLNGRGRPKAARDWNGVFRATSPAILEMAAFQAGRAIAYGSNPQLEGRIVSLDISTLVTRTHPLTRRPQCPACGDPTATRRPRALAINSVKKRTTDDGGHRSAGPDEAFAQLQHHISPITGIVKNLELTHRSADGLLNIYLAGHNFAMKNDSLFFLRHNLRSKSCGKGMSEAQARTSAICEAIERYCGVSTSEQPRITASYEELGDRAIHPNACMNFSDGQYAQREMWMSRGSPFQAVPLPFDPRAVIEWAPVWSMQAGDSKYLPFNYCYYGYPTKPEQEFCWADSNGNAAGLTLEEATLQGFFELIERDAVAIWWYNRLARPAIDVDSFGEPYVRELRRHYAELGREFWVLDLTHDFATPVAVAVSRRVGHPVEEIIFGFGAHVDARIAVLRALTEMNQFLPAVSGVGPQGQRDYGYMDAHAVQWWRTATVANQPYLLPRHDLPARTASDFAALGVASDDVAVDVARCVRTAACLGMDTLVLDQSRPDVNLRVAKVFVPGMRHFWARYGPGRLYDVPVRLGWLPRPLGEAELNPIPMFL